jgi:glycosyltransferase involved in cell wall biosynthesis
MNVLLLNALDIYGGGEFFVFQFADLLKKQGNNVWVSCREDNLIFEKCKKAGIDLLPIDYPKNGKGKLFRIIRQLKNFIIENKIEIVHSNTNYDRTAGAFASKWAGVKHITTNHSFHSIEYNPTHWYRNKRLVDHFIVDGECTRELLLEDDSIKENQISLIHLGIDPVTMKRDDDLRSKIRSEFGINENIILIGNVGRMVEFKGQEYLIRAYPEVLKRFPGTKLMVVGSGKLEKKLHGLAETLGLGNNVIFPGFRDDMQAVYSAFDIYAHTSVEGGGETFPYSMLYALAQGLPMVITRVGDMPAMVDEGINGFIVEDRKPELISEKLCLLTGDRELRNKMGKSSLNILHKKFTEDVMVRYIESVYRKVLGKS